MIEEARRKLGNEAVLDLANGDALPCASSSFDLVLLSMTLHELSEGGRSGILDEVKRVLKREGKALVLDYHPGPLSFPRGWLARPLILLVERVAGREHCQNYRGFISSGSVPQLADRHKFLIEEERIIKGGNFGLFLLSIGKRTDAGN
jgi:ubiquinone/menaquinone biosynthesis C-methylase UbiE